MPCVRWHGISEGLATGDSRPQDLPASLQAVSWQGPNNIGLPASLDYPAAEASGITPKDQLMTTEIRVPSIANAGSKLSRG
jgi:hypothetical protein